MSLFSSFHDQHFPTLHIHRIRQTFSYSSRSMYAPTRGGARGGAAEFSWDKVKESKDREFYLGNSVAAPTVGGKMDVISIGTTRTRALLPHRVLRRLMRGGKS